MIIPTLVSRVHSIAWQMISAYEVSYIDIDEKHEDEKKKWFVSQIRLTEQLISIVFSNKGIDDTRMFGKKVFVINKKKVYPTRTRC